MKRFLLAKLLFIPFIIIAFIGLPSCGNIASEARADYIKPTNHDSVDWILTSINADEKVKQLDALYQRKAKYGFNGCVLVAQCGQVLYKKAYGLSNFKTKDSLKINTAFQLASASKPFTATGILILMERGQLDLSDKVTKYIPEFPYSEITIKMLLTHRSGLNDYVYFGFPYCDNDLCYKGSPYDNNAVLEIMNTYKPPTFCSPDKKFRYCNTNYVILASIIEKISGTSYANFMRENIFVPLKMNNTWVRTANSNMHHKNVACGHEMNRRVEKNTYADDVFGDKGIYSTVEDMFKWDQALYTDKILKQETLEMAFSGYSKERGGKRNYGLGWRIIDYGYGKKDIYHNGWWHGYNSAFFRRPYDRITVIVLSNWNNKSAYLISDVVSIISKNNVFTDITEEL